MPAPHRAAAQHRAPPPRAQSAKSQWTGKDVFNPLAHTYTSPELERLGSNISKANLKAQLDPLQAQGREIQGTEGRVQGAYAGAGQTQQNLLGGIGTEAAAQAKTAQNQAAENALKISKGIETSGQQQAGMTAGYLAPEVRAELAAGAERGAATGVAGTNFAASQGLNETNYMANLRAAAAARTTEGGRQIAGIYGKQLGQVHGKEQEAIAKQPAEAKSLGITLGEKQFSELATSAGLPGVEAKIAAIRAGEAKTRAAKATAERGQNLTRQSAIEGHGIDAAKAAGDLTWKQADATYKKLSIGDKKAYDEWKMRNPGASTKAKPPNPAEGRKYLGEIQKVESSVRNALGAGREKYSHKRQEKVREELRKKNVNGDLISAAMNRVVYGKLGAHDKETARNYGLTPEIAPGWFT